MNKSYDVYMCRESEKEKAAFIERRRAQLAGMLSLKVIKESDAEEILEYAWVDYLRDKAETERQLADVELLRSSPFDRMPSKIEMKGMNEIFMREYCGRFEGEK